MSVSPRLDLVGIVTNDLARSLAFYRTLGLDIPETPADAPHVEFTFDRGLRLAWDALSTSSSVSLEQEMLKAGEVSRQHNLNMGITKVFDRMLKAAVRGS